MDKESSQLAFQEEYDAFGVARKNPTPIQKLNEGQVPNVVNEPVNPRAINSGQLSKQISLVKGFLQSSNFESGIIGWQIDADGDVEFNDGTFRGTVSGATIIGGTFETATSGQRVVITDTNNSITLYNSSGSDILDAGSNASIIMRILPTNNDRGALLIQNASALALVLSPLVEMDVQNAASSADTLLLNNAGSGYALKVNSGKVDLSGASSVTGVTNVLPFGNGDDGTKTFDGNPVVLGLGGTLTASGVTYTLTRDCYFNNLTVNNGTIVVTAGYRIFVKGTLNNNGTIQFNGGTGAVGTTASGSTGGAGGAGGTLASGSIYGGIAGASGGGGANGRVNTGADGIAGTAGTAGNNGTRTISTVLATVSQTGGAGGSAGNNGGVGGTGGATGTATQTALLPYTIPLAVSLHEIIGTSVNFMTTCAGTGGGGGGGSGASQNGTSNGFSGGGGGGGGAGSSGGILLIVAKIITNGVTGIIQANGGTGGAGGVGGNAGVSGGDTHTQGGGGGGAPGNGGNGGIVILISNSYTNNGTTQAAGGTAGAIGTGGTGVNGGQSGVDSGAGFSGTAGLVISLTNV